jgi:hypothetical protein
MCLAQVLNDALDEDRPRLFDSTVRTGRTDRNRERIHIRFYSGRVSHHRCERTFINKKRALFILGDAPPPTAHFFHDSKPLL